MTTGHVLVSGASTGNGGLAGPVNDAGIAVAGGPALGQRRRS